MRKFSRLVRSVLIIAIRAQTILILHVGLLAVPAAPTLFCKLPAGQAPPSLAISKRYTGRQRNPPGGGPSKAIAVTRAAYPCIVTSCYRGNTLFQLSKGVIRFDAAHPNVVEFDTANADPQFGMTAAAGRRIL